MISRRLAAYLFIFVAAGALLYRYVLYYPYKTSLWRWLTLIVILVVVGWSTVRIVKAMR